jgi:NADPH-dependent curcumin reductase CurA
MSDSETVTTVVFNEEPSGVPDPARVFRVEAGGAAPARAEGEVLLRLLAVSVDPCVQGAGSSLAGQHSSPLTLGKFGL